MTLDDRLFPSAVIDTARLRRLLKPVGLAAQGETWLGRRTDGTVSGAVTAWVVADTPGSR